MRSLIALALVLGLSCVSLVCGVPVSFPLRRVPVRVANHVQSSQVPPADLYPGLASSTQATQYTIGEVLRQPSLVGDTHNISYVFNITATHVGHMAWLDTALNSTSGPGYTLFLPDDAAMFEAKPRWEEVIKQKFNLTSVDISKTWNMTETNQTLEKEIMKYTHAGIMWSVVQGNHSLFNLSSENLLPTMLNDTEFVRLGPNATQFMRVIKGDNVTVYGIPITKKFPEMTHTNRTDVMLVSGSGHKLEQIGHVYKEILCSNGRIYILDRAVDFPFNTTDVLKSENATMFLAGIDKSGFNDTVNNTPNMTILVPSDEAIYNAMKRYAMNNETHRKWTIDQLKQILTPYIVNGTYYSKDLNNTSQITSIGGHVLNITHTPTETLINQNVSIIQADILTRNGLILLLNDTMEALEKQIIDQLPK